MHINIRYIITFTILSGILLTGCNTMQRIQTGELTTTFDRTFIQYEKHLRWGHFRELTTFMTTDHIGPTIEKIPAITLRDIRISRVKPTAWLLNYDTGVMVGDVIVDYYIASSGVIRSTTQNQTWRYDGEEWKLDNGLPDLK